MVDNLGLGASNLTVSTIPPSLEQLERIRTVNSGGFADGAPSQALGLGHSDLINQPNAVEGILANGSGMY